MAADFDPGTGLGPRLRQVRTGRQLSVRELARRVGCSASLISQIERGVSVPSVGVLYSLATELESSLDYLLFGSGSGSGSGSGPTAGTDGAVDGRSNGGVEAGLAGTAEPMEVAGLAQPAPIVQRGCDRRIIDLASGVRWERLTPQSEATTDFLEVIYSPGGHSTDERRPLRHDGREYGLIISGTLQANVGFESYELGPGDSIAFDSSMPHEYLNKTGDSVHAIWVVVHSEPGRA
jgi:transcriptional regulator with XRE-family HTH domain/mannose-6-phosphate isomerase-like protein (cupin superfamily)